MKDKATVGIIDYGCGNIRSVINALHAVGSNAELVSSADTLDAYAHLLLPGVGSFDHAIERLTARGFEDGLGSWIEDPGHKLMGICLGMQVLCDSSDESENSLRGLGFISGTVAALSKTAGCEVKIPHMGWNSLLAKDNPDPCGLLSGISPESDFYFLHSYGVQCRDPRHSLAVSTHGEATFDAVITNGVNVWGTQFHPEKSQHAGLRILENFCRHA